MSNGRLKTKNKLTADVTYQSKMETYCVKRTKDTENIDSQMFRRKNKRLIMQPKCCLWSIKQKQRKN